MNPDEKSGRIDAQLDFGTASDGRPVRVLGSFNCGRIGKTTIRVSAGSATTAAAFLTTR